MVVLTCHTEDQEYLQEFEVSLGYKVSPCLKNKQNYEEGLLVCFTQERWSQRGQGSFWQAGGQWAPIEPKSPKHEVMKDSFYFTLVAE